MRTVHKTTAIVAALGIAFGVTACGPATDSSPVAKSTPKATATTSAPTALQPVAPMSVDASLKKDLKYMASTQETWVTNHIGPKHVFYGVAVTATKPGGFTQVGKNNFYASPGNVVAVRVVKNGYCISVYNKAATKATSATKSLLYKSAAGGIQAGVGAC